MKQRKVISLPTNEDKIYKQILAFMNFMLNLTPQERDILAELIKLNNEYEALPPDKRAKFILSTDMRKEIREKLLIEEKQFNVILSKLKGDKKSFMGKPLLDENNMLHPQLQFKPDQDGFQFEVNLIMTTIPPATKKFTEELDEAIMEKNQEEQGYIEEQIWSAPVPDPAMEHAKAAVNATTDIDAAKAPVLEEEQFDFTLEPPND
jgi:hypothetical protein